MIYNRNSLLTRDLIRKKTRVEKDIQNSTEKPLFEKPLHLSWSRNSLLLWNPDVSFFSFHNNATIIPLLSLKTPIHKLQTSSFTKCVNITLPTTLNLPNFPFPCGFPKKFGIFLILPIQYTIQFFHPLVIFSFKFSSQYLGFV